LNYSKIIAGVMTWGYWGKGLSTIEMQRLIEHCLETGIHSFDHADIYGAYTTEGEFGKAISQMNLNRADYQLISKCGIQYMCEARDNKVKHYNYSKEYILWSVDQSLKNLQTEYLDLLLLHRPSPLMVPEEIAETAEILKKEGKIRSFGVSNFTASQMDMIGFRTDLACNQVEFSLTQHSAMHDGTFDHMMSNGIAAMAWSPLGSIFKEENETTKRVKNQLEPMMDKYEASMDQLLLAWILKHPARIYPVIGTTDPDRIKLAHQALTINLELEDWFLLLVASQGHKVP
jgi:predicted oxidoreductase